MASRDAWENVGLEEIADDVMDESACPRALRTSTFGRQPLPPEKAATCPWRGAPGRSIKIPIKLYRKGSRSSANKGKGKAAQGVRGVAKWKGNGNDKDKGKGKGKPKPPTKVLDKGKSKGKGKDKGTNKGREGMACIRKKETSAGRNARRKRQKQGDSCVATRARQKQPETAPRVLHNLVQRVSKNVQPGKTYLVDMKNNIAYVPW